MKINWKEVYQWTAIIGILAASLFGVGYSIYSEYQKYVFRKTFIEHYKK